LAQFRSIIERRFSDGAVLVQRPCEGSFADLQVHLLLQERAVGLRLAGNHREIEIRFAHGEERDRPEGKEPVQMDLCRREDPRVVLFRIDAALKIPERRGKVQGVQHPAVDLLEALHTRLGLPQMFHKFEEFAHDRLFTPRESIASSYCCSTVFIVALSIPSVNPRSCQAARSSGGT